MKVDVLNEDILVELMSKHDIVMNTVGPYFRFAKPIIKAAIKAKKAYFDICDDWKPMQEILELSDKAKQAGITGIVGIGASPGISNLLVKIACSRLEQVEEINTAWGISLTEKRGMRPKYFIRPRKLRKKLNLKKSNANAAIEHLIHESIGKIPTVKDGKLIEIDALKEAGFLDFPGFKHAKSLHIGHPEPVMLIRSFKAKSISNQMFLASKANKLVKKYAELVKLGKLGMPEATIKLNKKLNRLIIRYFVLFWNLIKEYYRGPPTICTIVKGMDSDGIKKKVAVGCYHMPHSEMAGVTGVPLAIAVLMHIEGRFSRKGIFTPEEIIDPTEFFDKYARHCRPGLKGKDVLIIKEEPPS